MLNLTWPESRRADAEASLLRHAGLQTAQSEPVETTFAELEEQLAVRAPALIRLADSSYVAVVRSSRRSLRVLAPDLTVHRVPLATLCDAIRAGAETGHRDEIERLMDEAGLSGRRRNRAVALLLREQLASTRLRDACTFHLPPGASTRPWLAQVGAVRNGFVLAVAHLAQYVLWVGSFWIVGQSALQGRLDRAWLLAWALVLLTLIPFRLLTTWLQGLIAIGVGGLLKQRLLAGALKLRPDEMSTKGIGHFLGQALEAETVETLAINGGIAGLLATLELIVAGVVLGRFAILLAAWWLLTLALGWRFLKRYRNWTQTRMNMTHELVESMVGQRTRLAQKPREQWHEDEDRKLEEYLGVSKTLDQSGALLIAGAPRGWLLVGIASIGPGFVAGQSAASDIAVAIGGALLAFTAFKRLAGSLSDIAAAWVAWLQVGPLFRAAARSELQGDPIGDVSQAAKIDADALVFRYRDRGEPVLRGCSLRVNPGDRILVEGPSGGGKSTFASVLSGLRQPESGLLLCGGLDLPTLGLDRWRQRVASAPQFHENHILTETLAFNLLMGRRWPPTQDDMAEAEELCVSLGLGDLLARMPGGILQMVGEGGWQLSHGERSRVFMARALLQGSGLVILDESFAALDPESLRLSLECALERANTLMVVAHP